MKNPRLVEAYLNNNASKALAEALIAMKCLGEKKHESAFWKTGWQDYPPWDLALERLVAGRWSGFLLGRFGLFSGANFQWTRRCSCLDFPVHPMHWCLWIQISLQFLYMLPFKVYETRSKGAFPPLGVGKQDGTQCFPKPPMTFDRGKLRFQGILVGNAKKTHEQTMHEHPETVPSWIGSFSHWNADQKCGTWIPIAMIPPPPAWRNLVGFSS